MTGRAGRPALEALRRVTSTLLDVEQAVCSLRPAVLELTSLLRLASTRPPPSREHIEAGETPTANGLAVSPTMAAMCCDDVARTVTFIRGAQAAIIEARKRLPQRPVSVLYAGCGPYATLAVPLMSVFAAGDVVFTLLDLHRESIESARAVVESLELGGFVAGFEVADAGAYRVREHQPPDVILLEVMQACLEAEPQVAVTRHLLRQAPDAILVPQAVRIECTLVDLAREFDTGAIGENREVMRRDRIPLGPVFVLDRESVRSWQEIADARLPAETVRIPDQMEPRYLPMLFTVITVHGTHVLRDYDSGLSCPRQLAGDDAFGPGDTVRFSYVLGAHPRLVARRSICGVEAELPASA